MIVKDEDALRRLESPMNLINKLKSISLSSRKDSMSLFGIGRKEEPKQNVEEVKISFNPFQPSADKSSLAPIPTPPQAPNLQPVLSDILENHESQIKLGLAHDSALALLSNSLAALSAKLDDVKADKLPSVIAAASKTVDSIRRERLESAKQGKDRDVHFHFYTPTQKSISDYEVIDVT